MGVDIESRIVWLFGSPRSGSTWLLQLLTRLTDGVPVNEPLIGAHLGCSLGGLLGLPIPDDPLISDTMAGRASYFFSPDTADVWQPLLRTLLLERFRVELERHEAAFGTSGPVIVKEPWGSVGAPILLQCLPRSRVVFLVRDGRDVVDSLVDGAEDGWVTKTMGARIDSPAMRERALSEYALMWTRSMRAVSTAFAAHAPELRYQLTYEALRAQPETELQEFAGWLDADLSRVGSVVESARFDRRESGAGKFFRSASPGLWREHFSAEEQAGLDKVMGPTLARLGYA